MLKCSLLIGSLAFTLLGCTSANTHLIASAPAEEKQSNRLAAAELSPSCIDVGPLTFPQDDQVDCDEQSIGNEQTICYSTKKLKVLVRLSPTGTSWDPTNPCGANTIQECFNRAFTCSKTIIAGYLNEVNHIAPVSTICDKVALELYKQGQETAKSYIEQNVIGSTKASQTAAHRARYELAVISPNSAICGNTYIEVYRYEK